jgi:beta-glucanase (GH16 family)
MRHTISSRPLSAIAVLLCVLLSSCVKNTEATPGPVGDAAALLSGSNTATVVCDYVLNENDITLAGYNKVFEDDFTTDFSKWNIWVGGAFNNELQYYQAENMQLANGNLVITAKKETVTGRITPFDTKQKTFNYTSGRIECKSNISASSLTPKVRMVARIKLPAGNGMWSAFWSYGDPWPTQGEIDCVEARGQEPSQYQTNYFYGKARNRNLVKNQVGVINSDVSLTDCYHVYEMIWSQNNLTSLLDGQVVETKTGSYIPNLFGKTERIVLNLAVGGDFFTNLDPAQIVTGSMYVDYVKVFTGK